MKRPTPNALVVHLTILLAAALLLAAGCGGDDPPPPDPQQVIEAAFPEGGDLYTGVTSATVEVSALGYQDSVLESRTVPVDAKTYAQVTEAIGGSGSGKGLFGLAENVKSVGTEDLDGTEVGHVTGDFDVKKLVDQLESSSQQIGATAASLSGVGELDELRAKLVEAKFDLYVHTEDSTFEQLDLTLSIDDRENASPPTKIRFRLTESDPRQAPN